MKVAYAANRNPTSTIVRNKAVLLPVKKRAVLVGFAIKMVVATALDEAAKSSPICIQNKLRKAV